MILWNATVRVFTKFVKWNGIVEGTTFNGNDCLVLLSHDRQSWNAERAFPKPQAGAKPRYPYIRVGLFYDMWVESLEWEPTHSLSFTRQLDDDYHTHTE